MKRKIVAVLLLVCMLFAFSAEAFAAVKVKSIKIKGGNVCILVGQTQALKVVFTPSNATNKGVTWSTSNKNIATVSAKGVVTGKKPGTVTITATSKENKKIKATCKIEVCKQPAVTSVRLNKTKVNMLGEKVTLKATCSPATADQSVTWTTSNKKIATVSNKGVVTPKGYGTCTITAKSNNGKTATCTITIKQENLIKRSDNLSAVPQLEMKDNFSMIVDGLTGKIKESSIDCWQDVRDISFGVACEIKKGGIKKTNVNQEKGYVDFRSSYELKLGVGISGLKATGSVITCTSFYRLDKYGKLTLQKYERSDLLGLCKLFN